MPFLSPWIAALLFGGDVILYLLADWFALPVRKVAKALFLPLLTVLYLSITDAPVLPLLLALLFSWAGDLLLLYPADSRLFVAGASCFALGHLFYTLTLFIEVGASPMLLAILPVSAVWLLYVGKRELPRLPKKLRFPCFLYCILLGLTAGSALALPMAAFSPARLLTGLGGLFFLCSDAILLRHRFGHGLKRGNFFISSTYILAQTSLILGICL